MARMEVFIIKININDFGNFNALLVQKGFSKVINLSQPMTIQLTKGNRNPSPRTERISTEVLEAEFDDIFLIESGGN